MTSPDHQPLSVAQIKAQLPTGWHGDTRQIRREFTFQTYQQGVDFTVQVAALAEQQNHHPDITLGFRCVTVTYHTHDAGGVTTWDVRAAHNLNGLLNEEKPDAAHASPKSFRKK